MDSTTEKFYDDLSNISHKKLIDLNRKQLSDLCQTGGRSFNMSVPASITDSDMIYYELIKRFKELILQQEN